MSLAQGYPSTFSDTQQTIEVLRNLDNETKKIYSDVNGLMAAGGHGHTGSGSDGAEISSILMDLAGMSENKHLMVTAAGDAVEGATPYKAIQFTRAMNGTSGNVAYTGIGFKPSAIIVKGVGGGTDAQGAMSTGEAQSGMTGQCVFNSVIAGGWGVRNGELVHLTNTGTDGQTALLASMDANGFTLAWTKIGNWPTTGYLYVLALR